MRKKRFVLLTAGTAVLLAGMICMIYFYMDTGSETGLRLQNRNISAEEYLQCMEAVRYDTTAQIQDEYGIDPGDKAQWLEEVKKPEPEDGKKGRGDAETPCELLMDNTIEKIKQIHAVFEISEEAGYIEGAGYEDMIERMEAENERRKEALESGQPVYGLTEYTPELYMEYELSALRDQYCQDGSNPGMELTESETEDYFNSREWIVGREGEKASLDSVRVIVEQELRKQKYDKMIEERAGKIEVTVDREILYQFTADHI